MANRVATVHVLSLWLVPFISSLSTKTWKSIFDHSSRTWIQIALNMLENFLNTSSWLSLHKWTTRCKSKHEISSSLSFPHGFMEETSDSLSTPPTLHCRALGAQVLGCSAFSGASLSSKYVSGGDRGVWLLFFLSGRLGSMLADSSVFSESSRGGEWKLKLKRMRKRLQWLLCFLQSGRAHGRGIALIPVVTVSRNWAHEQLDVSGREQRHAITGVVHTEAVG